MVEKRSRATAGSIMLILNMVAMMTESPKHARFICKQLGIRRPYFYDRIQHIKQLGFHPKTKSCKWYIESTDEPIKTLLTTIAKK